MGRSFLLSESLPKSAFWKVLPMLTSNYSACGSRKKDICALIKKYSLQVGIQVRRGQSRGICPHSLRKTVAMNALEHGADIMQVKALRGHAHVSTTQVYHEAHERDAEKAARHIQIR
jgi:site-specific recombinase XerD